MGTWWYALVAELIPVLVKAWLEPTMIKVEG